jgi:hypothetical protein
MSTSFILVMPLLDGMDWQKRRYNLWGMCCIDSYQEGSGSGVNLPNPQEMVSGSSSILLHINFYLKLIL